MEKKPLRCFATRWHHAGEKGSRVGGIRGLEVVWGEKGERVCRGLFMGFLKAF